MQPAPTRLKEQVLDSPGYVLLVECDELTTRKLAGLVGAKLPFVRAESEAQARDVIEARFYGLRGAIIGEKSNAVDMLEHLRLSISPDFPALVVADGRDAIVRRLVLRRKAPYVDVNTRYRHLRGVGMAFARYASADKRALLRTLEDYRLQARLAPRHIEILDLRLRGIPRSDLPAALGVSQSTIDDHLNTILTRTGMKRFEDVYADLVVNAHAPATEPDARSGTFVVGTPSDA